VQLPNYHYHQSNQSKSDYYAEKVIFEKSYLYSSKKVNLSKKINLNKITLKKIIKKYNLMKNIIIKSDIEGFELQLLDELKDIVPKYRPQLAISIYHFVSNVFPIHSHLVMIPKKLINICKNYKFFINHYTYNRRETVMYCIPNEISIKTS